MLNVITNNPFRLLGVGSNAPATDIENNYLYFKQAVAEGSEIKDKRIDMPGILGPINRTEDTMLEAKTLLKETSLRICYAQFWFMRSSGVDDMAFSNINVNNIGMALSIWSKQKTVLGIQNSMMCYMLRNQMVIAILNCATKLYSDDYREEYLQALGGGDLMDLTEEDLIRTLLNVFRDEAPFIINVVRKEVQSPVWQRIIDEEFKLDEQAATNVSTAEETDEVTEKPKPMDEVKEDEPADADSAETEADSNLSIEKSDENDLENSIEPEPDHSGNTVAVQNSEDTSDIDTAEETPQENCQSLSDYEEYPSDESPKDEEGTDGYWTPNDEEAEIDSTSSTDEEERTSDNEDIVLENTITTDPTQETNLGSKQPSQSRKIGLSIFFFLIMGVLTFFAFKSYLAAGSCVVVLLVYFISYFPWFCYSFSAPSSFMPISPDNYGLRHFASVFCRIAIFLNIISSILLCVAFAEAPEAVILLLIAHLLIWVPFYITYFIWHSTYKAIKH